MLAELFPSLAFAEADDAGAAEPLPEARAPGLLACAAVWDCVEALAWPEADVCAAVAQAPSIAIASNENICFIWMIPPVG
jgi:hypothetical protein